MNKCETCRYFEHLRCHRYPPIVYDTETNAEFADVRATDWCGEWHEIKELQIDKMLRLADADNIADDVGESTAIESDTGNSNAGHSARYGGPTMPSDFY